jgi:hypothetical protein
MMRQSRCEDAQRPSLETSAEQQDWFRRSLRAHLNQRSLRSHLNQQGGERR